MNHPRGNAEEGEEEEGGGEGDTGDEAQSGHLRVVAEGELKKSEDEFD